MEQPSHDAPSLPQDLSELLGIADVHDLRALAWRLELYSELACDPGMPHEELLGLSDHIDSLPDAARSHYAKYIDAFTAAMDAKLGLPDIFDRVETTLEAKIIIRAHSKGRSVRLEGLLGRLFPDHPSLEDRDLLEGTLQGLVDKNLLIKSKRLSYYLPGTYHSEPYKPTRYASSDPSGSEKAEPTANEPIDDKIRQAIGKSALAKLPNKLPGNSINNKTRRRGGQSRKRG